MLILNANDVRNALPMAAAIVAAKAAYAALSGGQAQTPLRSRLAIPAHKGESIFMPAHVQTGEGEALALKVVSLFPGNLERGLPLIHAAVLALEANSGRPIALLEGSTLTAIRTGAASGAATDLLAPQKAKTAAIFGAGVQARSQIEAICAVRKLKTIWIYDLDPQKAHTLATELAGKGNIPTDLRVAADPIEAASPAEILCTATTAREPVYPAEAIAPGAHINGVGSYTLEMRENPPELYARAAPFVDSRSAALAEAGETVAAIQRGLLCEADLTELGEVIRGQKPGRTSPEQITFFKSVGVAAQDAVAARVALHNARELGLGQRVTW